MWERSDHRPRSRPSQQWGGNYAEVHIGLYFDEQASQLAWQSENPVIVQADYWHKPECTECGVQHQSAAYRFARCWQTVTWPRGPQMSRRKNAAQKRNQKAKIKKQKSNIEKQKSKIKNQTSTKNIYMIYIYMIYMIYIYMIYMMCIIYIYHIYTKY